MLGVQGRGAGEGILILEGYWLCTNYKTQKSDTDTVVELGKYF